MRASRLRAFLLLAALAFGQPAAEAAPAACPCFDAERLVGVCSDAASCRVVSGQRVSLGGTRDALSCGATSDGVNHSYQVFTGAEGGDLCVTLERSPGTKRSHSSHALLSGDATGACRDVIAIAAKRLACAPVATTDPPQRAPASERPAR